MYSKLIKLPILLALIALYPVYFSFYDPIPTEALSSQHSNITVVDYALTQYKSSNENGWFYAKLTICIGVQKSGTVSLREALKHIGNIRLHNKEIHLFDSKILNSVDGHELDSFHLAIESFNKSNKTNVAQYIELIQTLTKSWSHNLNSTKPIYYYTKTAQYCVFPHIAHIVVNMMVKYGTKILILLRDPIKRFISGYFQVKNSERFTNKWPDHGINEYLDTTYDNELHGDHSFAAFNSYLKHLYLQYIDDNMNNKEILNNMSDRYNDFVYFYTRHYLYIDPTKGTRKQGMNQYYLIWIRSCYAPQIFPWLYVINNLENNDGNNGRYKHQFKIVQSEQLFDKNKYKNIIRSIRCYIEYDIVNYAEYDAFMKACVSRKEKVHHLKHKNSKTKAYDISMTTEHIESLSFEFCNKWLGILMKEFSTLDLVLGSFDWNVWKHISEFAN